jgi:hypothetical protein
MRYSIARRGVRAKYGYPIPRGRGLRAGLGYPVCECVPLHRVPGPGGMGIGSAPAGGGARASGESGNPKPAPAPRRPTGRSAPRPRRVWSVYRASLAEPVPSVYDTGWHAVGRSDGWKRLGNASSAGSNANLARSFPTSVAVDVSVTHIAAPPRSTFRVTIPT